MKTLLPLLWLLWLNPAHAFPLQDPCAGWNCTETMRAIAGEYIAAGGLKLETLPQVASGECYHLSPDYKPDTRHFGYALLDPHEGAFYMDGSFGFYFPENPYARLTVAQAREKSPNLYADHKRLELGSDYAFANMNPKDPRQPILYWLKQNGDTTLLVGQWGPWRRFFCRFGANP